jgi:hypothetical protein
MPSKQHHFDELPGLEIPHTPFTYFKKFRQRAGTKSAKSPLVKISAKHGVRTSDVICRLQMQLKRREYSNPNVLRMYQKGIKNLENKILLIKNYYQYFLSFNYHHFRPVLGTNSLPVTSYCN